MRELPKFMFLTHPDMDGVKIISTEHPYLIAEAYQIRKTQESLIDSFLEDMVQGRYPMSKVPGYYVFLRMYTSLEPCNDRDFQQRVLNEMAQFFLEEKISHKPGLYAKSEESGKAQRKFERVAQRIKRERIKKSEQ